jgi:hypothetical protein
MDFSFESRSPLSEKVGGVDQAGTSSLTRFSKWWSRARYLAGNPSVKKQIKNQSTLDAVIFGLGCDVLLASASGAILVTEISTHRDVDKDKNTLG